MFSDRQSEKWFDVAECTVVFVYRTGLESRM